jgi:ubiquinone/menaquinone biosynthesis C-methylase UbiE
MTTEQIQFTDGATYERYMGLWSQLVGLTFLDWLAPAKGLRWLDVGCGNGAFTEMLVARCAPASVHGIDPSEGQLEFARKRSTSKLTEFRQGDAMALPFPDNQFDAAVMPLVIFFVPVPATGVAEMARVVCPGGSVAAYSWDIDGGGFPYQKLNDEIRAMGVEVPQAPNTSAARIDVMTGLWAAAGLEAIETREITVERTFQDFNDYWTTILGGPNVGPKIAAMSADDTAALKERMRKLLLTDSTGRITYAARATAIKGYLPAKTS